MEDPCSEVFKAPVDWEALGLPTYPRLIKKPMDLGSVHSNIKKGRFKTYQEVLSDI
jgi:hypothetical protein